MELYTTDFLKSVDIEMTEEIEYLNKIYVL